MDSKKCQFCEHGNPADSKYCSECGGCLYLLPCPHCGAVTDATTATCYQCNGQLQGGWTDAAYAPRAAAKIVEGATQVATPDTRYMLSPVSGMSKFDALASALPIAETSRSPSRLTSRLNIRPNARVAASVALLALIAALGYYVYHQRFMANTPKPPAADIEASSRGVPSSSRVIRSEAPAAAVSTDAKAVAAPGAGRFAAERATDPAGAAERGASAGAACAPAVAALGLCAATPAPAKEAEADVVLTAANARPPGAGKATPAPANDAACAQGMSVLGLCALSTSVPAVPAVTHTQRKE